MLLSLGLSSGTLSPELEPGFDAYEVVIPVFVQNLTLVPEAPVDASVTIGGATIAPGTAWTSLPLSLGHNEIRVLVEQRGQPSTEYTLSVTRGAAATAYLKASNTGADDLFGGAVALSGDGTTLAVGAVRESSSARGVNGNQSNDEAPRSGAVYVFVRSESSWTQQAYVKASNTGAGDRFGASVALSDDGRTLVVGAPEEASNTRGVGGDPSNDEAPYSGAVYVFVRSGSEWAQPAYVEGSSADSFGAAVALSRDGSTLAVGTTGEDSAATGVGGDQSNDGAPDSGAVYVSR